MNAVETMIWSAHAGAFAMMTMFGLLVAMRHRTTASVQYIVFALFSGFCMMGLNGLLLIIAPDMTLEQYHAIRVVGPTTCAAIAASGLRDWLGTRQRTRTIDRTFVFLSIVDLLAGFAIHFTLPPSEQLQASALVVVVSVLIFSILCVCAAMMGDAIAWYMSFFVALQAAALGGKFSLVTGGLDGTQAHALAAILNIGAYVGVSLLLWQRSHKEYSAVFNDRDAPHKYDPATGLYNSSAIVRKIISAQSRLQIRGAQGLVLAIHVLDTSRLLELVGHAGVQQLYIRVGARVRRSVGLINPVGRYFDRCFIVVLEAPYSPEERMHLLQSLQQTLSRPMDIKGQHGEMHSLTLLIGVGSARLDPTLDVSTVLDKAQRAARLAAGITPDPSEPKPEFASSTPPFTPAVAPETPPVIAKPLTEAP